MHSLISRCLRLFPVMQETWPLSRADTTARSFMHFIGDREGLLTERAFALSIPAC